MKRNRDLLLSIMKECFDKDVDTEAIHIIIGSIVLTFGATKEDLEYIEEQMTAYYDESKEIVIEDETQLRKEAREELVKIGKRKSFKELVKKFVLEEM